MDSVGQKIREARLRLGLTLEQISAKTRISVKSLQAIETQDPALIGSPFLYRSFTRQFAEQLNLNYRDLETAIQTAASTIPGPLMPGQERAGTPKVPPLRVSRGRKVRWLNSVASLIFTLVACSTVYGMWQSSKRNVDDPILVLVKSWVHQAQREPANASASTKPIAAKPIQPLPRNEPDQAFHIELSALERTWLSIVADGKETFSGIMEATETKVLEGRDSARVRTGNAGAVNIVFNGKPLGTLGERGQVRTVVFTKEGYEVLQPPAHLTLVSFNQNAE